MLPQHTKHPNGIDIAGWRIRSEKHPILNSAELEALQENLNAPCMPEMVFGHNVVSLSYGTGDRRVELQFNAVDALRDWAERAASTVAVRVGDDTDTSLLKVAHSADWSEKRRETVRDMKKKECDWTYTTYYNGTLLLNGNRLNAEDEHLLLRPTTDTLPLELLKRHDPILFFTENILFEDEYDDNGTAIMTVKMRVMPRCVFLLLRFWMRVDGVMFRVVDTRYCHEFGMPVAIREVQVREATFESLKDVLPEDRSKLTQEDVILPLLPVVRESRHSIHLDAAPEPLPNVTESDQQGSSSVSSTAVGGSE